VNFNSHGEQTGFLHQRKHARQNDNQPDQQNMVTTTGEITIERTSTRHVAEPTTVNNTKAAHRNRLDKLVVLHQPSLKGLLVTGAYLLVLLLTYLGWTNRAEQPLTAESGVGYWLGVIGGVLMLLLLLYPLRKHARFMRELGRVKYWFRLHMLFGIVGPVCILFHSGFRFGSLNSKVALTCMLLVATSGLVGRYFYIRIHHGLYGRKATLNELQQHAAELKGSLSRDLRLSNALLARLETFERRIEHRCDNLLSGIWLLFSIGIRTWMTYFGLKLLLLTRPALLRRNDGRRDKQMAKAIVRHIGAHLSVIRKVAEFQFYDRLFGIWHLLHFPLFLMLLISGTIHVLAVHIY
jgi:hypothetical protein